ncbi:uncharacterized protein [Amphiura filiformis]|uniref:uncharacterized protein n=1 Tax=Amphiura filiformis TaxID=82378 RepID=UPI003B216D18
MGSLFQNGRVRLNIGGPKYQRLENTDPWVGLDDDEDDELLTNNPAYRDKDDGDFEELTIDVGNDDERFLYDRRMLERQGSPLYKTLTAKQQASCQRNQRRWFCSLVAVFLCISVVCLIYFLLPCSSESSLGSTNSTILETSRDFAINVTGGTETTIRLFDVNNDGIEDVIFGYSRAFEKLDEEGRKAFCEYINMAEPCLGAVRAVDGRDGTLLWEHNLECEVFAIQCGQLDVNEDGMDDCLVAGRLGVLQAVDSTDGTILWSADPTMTNDSWNYYQPQVVPDLDGDGVYDVVATHGGNGDYHSDETDRDANRLLLLSGKTGKSLGKKYLETPDQKETYSAVTLYEKDDGAVYVLFGTGGETVQGSLWVISLLDLFCHVMDYGHECNQAPDAINKVPAFQHAHYDDWGKPLQAETSAREILRCDSNKGIMVPTVLADMNQDGTMDLIVSVFNGTIAVLDGHDFSIMWTTEERYAEYETYSTPAPGYFNSDNIPDVMIRLSHGNWTGHYDFTLVFILDGRNGQMLWSSQSHSKEAVMSSPLSIKGQDNKDAFLFWMQGRNNDAGDRKLNAHHQHITTQPTDGKHDRLRRHGGETMNINCEDYTKQFEAELFLMNRDIAQNPLRIELIEPPKVYLDTQKEQSTIFSPENSPLRRKRNHESSSNSSQALELPESPSPISKVLTSPKMPTNQRSTASQQTQTQTMSPKPSSNTDKDLDADVPLAVTEKPNEDSNAGTPVPVTEKPDEDSNAGMPIPVTEKSDEDSEADMPLAVTERPSSTTFATTLKTSTTAQSGTTFHWANKPFDGYPYAGTDITSPSGFDSGLKLTSPKPQTTPHVDHEFPAYFGNPFDDDDDDDENGLRPTSPKPQTTPSYDAFYDGYDNFGHNQGHHFEDDLPGDFIDMPPPDEADNHPEENASPPCFLEFSWIRSTGTIGDLDNDGVLDIIYIMTFIAPSEGNNGHMGINKAYSTLVKKSFNNANQDYVRLDPKKTYCDASVKGQPLKDGKEDFDFKMDGESKWMGYCGTDGDCHYE